MELSIDHESKAIILWLSSSRTVNLEPLILKGKELKYRVVVIRSGFGDLIFRYLRTPMVQPASLPWKPFPWMRAGSILALKKGRRLQ